QPRPARPVPATPSATAASIRKLRLDIISVHRRIKSDLVLSRPARYGPVEPADRDKLESVNQIELLPFQVRLFRPLCRRPPGSEYCMLQARVQCSSHPQRISRDCIRRELPKSINAMLQDVTRGTLLAFCPGCDDRILFRTPPRVSDL